MKDGINAEYDIVRVGKYHDRRVRLGLARVRVEIRKDRVRELSWMEYSCMADGVYKAECEAVYCDVELRPMYPQYCKPQVCIEVVSSFAREDAETVLCNQSPNSLS